jgi:farnesyl-diphosphate farnesyltransferase
MQSPPLESQKLGGALLASVSRSFYISIKVLPPKVRDPLGLAYLLARTTDTIADASEAPVALRLKHLAALEAMIHGEGDAEKIKLLQNEIVPPDKAERELLRKIEPCLLWLRAQREDDRADIVAVLEKIIRGQTLDLNRFPSTAPTRALQNAAELDEYIYLVAGCVGEFWTRICCRHVKHYSQLNEQSTSILGVNFGKGLQLVNILRDIPADLRAGRCYLPADELKSSGVDPAAILGSPELARPVFDRWLKKATCHLDDAFKYIEVLSNRRVRIACILPWDIGMQTLALLAQNYPLAVTERVKVTRAEVRKIMFLAPVTAMSNKALRRLRAELNRKML